MPAFSDDAPRVMLLHSNEDSTLMNENAWLTIGCCLLAACPVTLFACFRWREHTARVRTRRLVSLVATHSAKHRDRAQAAGSLGQAQPHVTEDGIEISR